MAVFCICGNYSRIFLGASSMLFASEIQCMDIKGKSVPLQAWSGPEGSRKLRFPDF